jgi:hypothetical protein
LAERKTTKNNSKLILNQKIILATKKNGCDKLLVFVQIFSSEIANVDTAFVYLSLLAEIIENPKAKNQDRD